MDIEIRTITEDERVDWIRAAETSFSSTAKDDEIEAFASRHRGRSLVRGRRRQPDRGDIAPRSTFRMMVPGGARVPTAGVTMVGVHPTHRRRGINRRMMTAILEQAAERGEPLAALFASEGAIYGRFGYGLAAGLGEFQAESARMAFVRRVRAERTRRARVSKEDAMPVIDRVYDAALRPGGVERERGASRSHVRDRGRGQGSSPWMYAIHRDDAGEADAYAVYWVKLDWPRSVPTGTITVREVRRVHAFRARGHLAVPLRRGPRVATVEAWNRPVDEPLLHLLREPRRLRFSVVRRSAAASGGRRRRPGGAPLRGRRTCGLRHRRPAPARIPPAPTS